MQLPCTWRVSAHPSHSSSSSSSSSTTTTTTTNPQHQICRPQNNLLQQVQEHSDPEEEEVPSLGEAPACSQAHSACVHPSPADLQAPSAGHYPPASSSLSRRSFSGQPAARPYHRWQHPLLVLLSVCPVTIRRRSLHCSLPWLQTELLACLFVCLFPCSFVCLLACLGVMERTSSHQSSESVHSNLEAELWIPDGEMRNQQRNPPAINPQEEQTNKQTHFYFKACRLKLRFMFRSVRPRELQLLLLIRLLLLQDLEAPQRRRRRQETTQLPNQSSKLVAAGSSCSSSLSWIYDQYNHKEKASINKQSVATAAWSHLQILSLPLLQANPQIKCKISWPLSSRLRNCNKSTNKQTNNSNNSNNNDNNEREICFWGDYKLWCCTCQECNSQLVESRAFVFFPNLLDNQHPLRLFLSIPVFSLPDTT